jgi:hypothetical protein
MSSNSGAHTDNGEGSSSPRRSQDARPTTSATNGVRSLDSASTLARHSIHEEDFARRKQRVRRSGGFLLDSNFPSGPRQRHGNHEPHAEDPRGKRSSRHEGSHEKDGRQEGAPKIRLSPSSSPLSQEVQRDGRSPTPGASRNDFAGPQARDNDRIAVGKTRRSAYDMHSIYHDRELSPTAAPQRAAIDPNQLVHMALNLSESRRRNISTGQLLASQSRVASGAHRDGSFSNYGAGGSLKQHLNEQRRASRNISPIGGKSSSSRHMSTSVQRSASMAFPGAQTINPSSATLARVEKARAYIELRMEYLRLLEHLPPLKPDANAPGNFVVSSTNVPGSPQAHLTRVPSYAGKHHELGRPYNPLQYIRNRRSRARERVTLDHTSAEFEHVDQVREWVDRVEQQAKRAGYRQDDTVQLPKLHHDHPVGPAPSKPARPHKGWVFSPQELIADAHWLEQDDNKMLVENRHGLRVFPPKEPKQQDLLHPRASKEYPEKRRRSWIEGQLILRQAMRVTRAASEGESEDCFQDFELTAPGLASIPDGAHDCGQTTIPIHPTRTAILVNARLAWSQTQITIPARLLCCWSNKPSRHKPSLRQSFLPTHRTSGDETKILCLTTSLPELRWRFPVLRTGLRFSGTVAIIKCHPRLGRNPLYPSMTLSLGHHSKIRTVQLQIPHILNGSHTLAVTSRHLQVDLALKQGSLNEAG